MNSPAPITNSTHCVEHGKWTAVPEAPPRSIDAFTLHYKDVDRADHDSIQKSGRMAFHIVGCTGDAGDHEPQQAVCRGMAAQILESVDGDTRENGAVPASFLYHLGDITYKPGASSDVMNGDAEGDDVNAAEHDRGRMYNEQFYAPFAVYRRPIFAIAGNHDGKASIHRSTSAIGHFFTNFCASVGTRSDDNLVDSRGAMTQPYVYWRLNTPLMHIIGLYANVENGGMLDDPRGDPFGPQYKWLVAQLKGMRAPNGSDASRKAIVLAVHYPPYSGATNFSQRGDPRLGPSNAQSTPPLAVVLQRAFAESGQRPDVVVSAHAHLYQRLTYRYADGWQMPCVVAGSGGHAPVERLFHACDGTMTATRSVPFDAVSLPGFPVSRGETVQVEAYDDRSFGFLRITVDSAQLMGEFFTASPGPLTLVDSFVLDLQTHTILGQ